MAYVQGTRLKALGAMLALVVLTPGLGTQSVKLRGRTARLNW